MRAGSRDGYKLTDGLGLDRDRVTSMVDVLPETKSIVESYSRLCAREALYGRGGDDADRTLRAELHRDRMAAMLAAYDFIDAETLSYFKKRLTHAPRDASFALDYVLEHDDDDGSAAGLLRRCVVQVPDAVVSARQCSRRIAFRERDRALPRR